MLRFIPAICSRHKKTHLDQETKMGLFFPADVVRSTSRIHRRFTLPRGICISVTACNVTINPPGTKVNPPLAPLLALLSLKFGPISSRRTRVSPAWGENRQETRLYVDALETGAYGKTDLATLKEAGPGHQDGERFLTVSHVRKQLRQGAKRSESSTWMSYGLDGVWCLI